MGQKKILIIDDEHSLLRLSQIIFQRKGYQVEIAIAIAEGKRVLQDKGSFDAIILDLMMPNENGFDFLHWREEQSEQVKSTPVIVNTAKNLSDDERLYLTKNSSRIMQKGINFADKLISEVESLLGKQAS